MNRIVITLPDFFDGEASRIAEMLDAGALWIHIRKPGATEAKVRCLIEEIPERYRLRLTIHDFPNLAMEYGLGGVHLNSRCSLLPTGFTGRVSRSCHSIAEILADNTSDYMLLSSIFDSISKPGYRGAFSDRELREALADGRGKRVYALGGVIPARFKHLEELGFGGCAMLGSAWTPVDRQKFMLQLITPDRVEGCAEMARLALEGGCRWVQLRHKDATTASIIEEAALIGKACREYGAVFLIDDRVDLVEACGADGVHLGKNDMPADQARKLLGPGYIIGTTANTFDDIRRAADAGADYIGLGPLRFTTTKKNLSPVLGVEGYSVISKQCRKAGIDLPIVAIGGITADDIPALGETGVSGVAISGTIARSADPTETTNDLVRQLKQHIQL